MFTKLKIIDASTVLAGPSVGTFFAELGADVLKIENPSNKDVTRSWKLPNENPNLPISSYFASINFKKKYSYLDLTSEKDKLIFFEHIKSTDILITNFKKGDDQKFGIDDEKLRKINPRLIHAKISGYGLNSDRVAYDLILQAESGFMSMNGDEHGLPTKMPIAFIDVLAAHHLKEGILLALLNRMETGLGKTVHVSLYKAAVASLVNQASNYLMNNEIPKRMGSLHPNISPYGEIFTTKDNAQITFAVGSDVQFKKLCVFLNLPHLLEDVRYNSNQNRVRNRLELAKKLQEEIVTFDANEILDWSMENFVPCGKIKNLKDVFAEKEAQSLVRNEIIDGLETSRVSSIAFDYD
jgi:crotonobetainyl-CoA:carnitine CoA-transferase CaiB-like acyl-CoA transferase